VLKFLQGLILMLSGFSVSAVAQNQAFKCDFIDPVSLDWIEGEWEVSKLNTQDSFLLYVTDGDLRNELNEGNLDSPMWLLDCRAPALAITGFSEGRVQVCNSYTGDTISFNFDTLTGVYAQPTGGLSPRNAPHKFPITMMPFTCEIA